MHRGIGKHDALDCRPPPRRKNRGAGRARRGIRGYETVHQHVGLAAAFRDAGAALHSAEGLAKNLQEARFCLLTMFGSYESENKRQRGGGVAGESRMIGHVVGSSCKRQLALSAGGHMNSQQLQIGAKLHMPINPAGGGFNTLVKQECELPHENQEQIDIVELQLFKRENLPSKST